MIVFGEIYEWLKYADCKSVAPGFEGSNPSLSTRLSKKVGFAGIVYWYYLGLPSQ